MIQSVGSRSISSATRRRCHGLD